MNFWPNQYIFQLKWHLCSPRYLRRKCRCSCTYPTSHHTLISRTLSKDLCPSSLCPCGHLLASGCHHLPVNLSPGLQAPDSSSQQSPPCKGNVSKMQTPPLSPSPHCPTVQNSHTQLRLSLEPGPSSLKIKSRLISQNCLPSSTLWPERKLKSLKSISSHCQSSSRLCSPSPQKLKMHLPGPTPG